MPHIHEKNQSEENIKIAFFLNLGFSLIEIFGGIFTNSMAILADALHDFGDSLSLAFSWRMEKLSNKAGDQRYSYGYKRFSLLSAVITAVILISGSVFVLTEAVQRLLNPQSSNASGMLVFAVAGILINGYAALRTSRGKNLNSRMISWHMFEDVLGWAAVLVVSIVLLVRDIKILDPLLSMGVTAIVLFNVIRNLKQTLSLFCRESPSLLILRRLRQKY